MSQWVLYRPGVGSLLRAQLPSAADVGGGWRGAQLRAFGDLAQLDEIVIDTAGKTGAAIGVAVAEGSGGYLTAAAGEPGRILARLTFGAEPTPSSEAKAFAEWSDLCAPSPVAAKAVAEALEAGSPEPMDGVSRVLEMIGLSLPEGVPHYGSLHDVARASREQPPKKKGIFRRRG